MRPTEFTHSATRKARYLSLFHSYEDEMERLMRYVDSLETQVGKFKEASRQFDPSCSEVEYNGTAMLIAKLDDAEKRVTELSAERDTYCAQANKLESENSILMQDMARLRASLVEKSAQMTSKYTVAALESRVESFEKETRRLQKALANSDKYVAELEVKLRENGIEFSSMSQYDSAEEAPVLASLPPLAAAPSGESRQNKTPKSNHCSGNIRQNLTSPAKTYSNSRVVLIPNDRFYRSPSKSLTKESSNCATPTVSSFVDRFKKAATNLTEAEQQQHQQLNQQQTTSNVNQQITPPSSVAPSTVHLFSPMKRLRLDEMSLVNTNENLSPHRLSESASSDTKRFQLSSLMASQPFSQHYVDNTRSHSLDHSYINIENQSSFN